MASETDKPRPAVPQLFELDVSQQPVKPPPAQPKSPLAARQARATALALSHHVSSGSLTPPKPLQRGPSSASSAALEALPSMASSATILPRPSPDAGRASAAGSGAGLTTGKAAVSAARGAAASPSASPVVPSYNRRASGPASSAAASAVRQVSNSHALPPLTRSPAASPVPSGAGALPALSGVKAKGGVGDSPVIGVSMSPGMPRSSSVPALARGSPAAAGAASGAAAAPGGRRSSLKGGGKQPAAPPPPEPEVALAKAGLGFFSFGSMVNVVDAVMGKAPEARRSGPGELSAAVAAIIRTQLPDLVLGNRQTPGVARGGGIYVASGSSVYVIDEDGREMSPIPCAAVGLSDKTFVAACDPISRLVFAADCDGEESVLVAFKPQPLGEATVRWCTRPGEVYNCYGVAVLPKQELVIAASYHGNALQAYRTTDGGLCGTCDIREPTYTAADAESATVYVSSFEPGKGGRILGAQWRVGALVATGEVAAAGVTDARRPVAVVPPGAGKSRGHLVVGSQRASTLLVLELPSLRLVHTHELEGVRITGLAADASLVDGAFKLDGSGARRLSVAAAAERGQSLVVMDQATSDVLVLHWPLPDMPELG